MLESRAEGVASSSSGIEAGFSERQGSCRGVRVWRGGWERGSGELQVRRMPQRGFVKRV